MKVLYSIESFFMNQKSIIIADDDLGFRMSLATVFEAAGYSIREAKNGLETIQFARESKPDIIVMDIRMPVMDGLTALGQLQNNEDFADIPIFIVTNVQEEITSAVESGAHEALLKSSVEPKQLVAAVEKLLAKGEKEKEELAQK